MVMGTTAKARVAAAVPRVGAAAGIAGPAVFTGPWIVSSLRQTGYPPADLQISGLAAADASAGVTAVLLMAYAADTSAPHAGIVQRAAVTLPLAAMAAIAMRLVRIPGG